MKTLYDNIFEGHVSFYSRYDFLDNCQNLLNDEHMLKYAEHHYPDFFKNLMYEVCENGTTNNMKSLCMLSADVAYNMAIACKESGEKLHTVMMEAHGRYSQDERLRTFVTMNLKKIKFLNTKILSYVNIHELPMKNYNAFVWALNNCFHNNDDDGFYEQSVHSLVERLIQLKINEKITLLKYFSYDSFTEEQHRYVTMHENVTSGFMDQRWCQKFNDQQQLVSWVERAFTEMDTRIPSKNIWTLYYHWSTLPLAVKIAILFDYKNLTPCDGMWHEWVIDVMNELNDPFLNELHEIVQPTGLLLVCNFSKRFDEIYAAQMELLGITPNDLHYCDFKHQLSACKQLFPEGNNHLVELTW